MNSKFVSPQLLMRVGLASVFLYAGFAALAQPSHWIGFVPHSFTNIIPADTFLKMMSLYELALGTLLLTGYYVRYAAALSALTLLGIISGSLDAFEVTFRDVGLLCMAIALFMSPENPAVTPKR